MRRSPLAATLFLLGILISCTPPPSVTAAADASFRLPKVKHVLIVVLENQDAADAERQPFLSSLAARGASFAKFYAITHPSQPNYFALTAGSTHGVRTNARVDLDVRHLGDLFEARGLDWKVYAEGYPGNCFLGERVRRGKEGEYVRRHVPFLSYRNVQNDPKRCARIVGANQLEADFQSGGLPAFALYIPDNHNNGHDTGVRFADRAMQRRFGELLRDRHFAEDVLFIVTFDESSRGGGNRILTVMTGSAVRPGARSTAVYNHYSLLRTIEEIFGVGTLGLADAKAAPIIDVWAR